MREIKFRAWDKDEKVMNYHGGSLAIRLNGNLISSYNNTSLSETFELMQFTGLKDKNGKEIYEGDIVKVVPSAFCQDEVQGEIGWFKGHCRFNIKNTNHYLDGLNSYEVIGNRFNNPDLITKEE